MHAADHHHEHAHAGRNDAAPAHGGHAHGGHAGHEDVYRRRFWINLLLAAPVVVYSESIQDWLGFTPPEFPVPPPELQQGDVP